MPALAHSTAYRGLSSMSTVAPISLQEVRHPSVPGQPRYILAFSYHLLRRILRFLRQSWDILQEILPRNKCSQSL